MELAFIISKQGKNIQVSDRGGGKEGRRERERKGREGKREREEDKLHIAHDCYENFFNEKRQEEGLEFIE